MTMTYPTVTELMGALDNDVGGQDPVAARAALLVAVAHSTRDRDVWGGDRAITFWDRFPERVRGACYGGPTLDHWWQRMVATLGCHQPRNPRDRVTLTGALSGGGDRAVLDVLRTRSDALCLRVRLAHQIHRDGTAPTPPIVSEPADLEHLL